ncbi:MAG TPA: DnaJ domain-containing protein [Armatimonadota bacterium]
MDSPDYYAILEVPFDADAAAIRRAYRRKVKELHPDVAKDKANANEAFLIAKEAYNVLSDPQRRTNYDVTYTGRRTRSQTTGRRPESAPQAPAADTWTRHQKSLTVAELLQRAMRELATGRNPYARRDLGEVLAREPENPDAMLLMGRLYRSEGRTEDWIGVLEEGLRKNPSNVAMRLALNDALRSRKEKPFVRESPETRLEQRRRAYLATGLMGGAAAIMWGTSRTGPPIPIIEFAVAVPGRLMYSTAFAAALAGWTMAATGYISKIDDELFWPDTRGRSLSRPIHRNDAPLGLAVPVMALIHYFLAVSVMAVLMLTRGVFSRSLGIVSAVALGFAAAMAMAYPADAGGIFFWCPGWLLFAEFCGWYIGEFFRS